MDVMRRILIMDDDAVVTVVLERLLQRAGFETVSVENGVDALNVYKDAFLSNPFSLVFIDLTVPGGLGGEETVRELKRFDPNAKAVVFSGYSNDPIITDFPLHGFDGVLKKPFTNSELMNVLKSILGNE